MIVLDTHALVWWLSAPQKVPAKTRRILDGALESKVERLMVSTISAWEIALLVANDRLSLTVDVETWINRVEALPFVTFVAVDNRIALKSMTLEKFPNRDPADRIIAATALGLGASLVTADEKLRAYRPLKTIWD